MGDTNITITVPAPTDATTPDPSTQAGTAGRPIAAPMIAGVTKDSVVQGREHHTTGQRRMREK